MKSLFLLFSFFLLFVVWSAQETENTASYSYSLQPDLTKMELDEKKEKTAEIFLKISRLGNQLNQSDLSPHIRENLLLEISTLFKKAAESESNPKMKLYLSALSEDIKRNDFSSSLSNWINLDKSEIDILYSADSDKKQNIFVLFYDKKLTNKAGRYISLVEKMKSNTTRKYFSVLSSAQFRYPFLIADLLQGTGENRMVLNYPPARKDHESDQMKIIILRNLARFFFRGILKPLSKNVFPPRLSRMVDFNSYLSNMIMHKISHFLGPYFIKSKSEVPESIVKKLKDLFLCIEEIKADTVAFSNTNLLIKEKIVAKQKEKRIYATYIIGLIAKLRQNQDEKARAPYLIQLSYYIKNQGLVYSLENQVLLINFDKLKRDIRKLMEMVLRIQQNGSYSGAKQLIKEYSVMPQELTTILKKTETIPVNMKAKTTRQKTQSE